MIFLQDALYTIYEAAIREASIRTVKRIQAASLRVAILLGFLGVFLHAAPAQTDPLKGAQAADPDHPTISVTARLVVLDIVVTDPQGKPVPGLTQDDFIILQDGKPQKTHNFEGWNSHSPAAATPTTDIFGRQDWGDDVPLTIFVLDELNTPLDEKSFAVENLRNYLRHQPALLASPAMLVTVNYTGINTLSTYTRDRDTLLHALDRRPPALPANRTDLELAASSFAMLRQIALASEGMHTHKSIIWLGRGFPALDPDDFDDPANLVLKKAIQDTVDLLVAARITLYQVDPITTDARTGMSNMDMTIGVGGGISSHMASTGTLDLLDPTYSFNRFVLATGGQLYFGSNDLDRFIADGENRTTDFYTLSYVPPGVVDESVYHTISVQMRNPSLHAETRQGFYSLQPTATEPSLHDLGFDLKLASTGAMTYSSVAARISGIKAARTPGKIAVSFSVEDRSLQWTTRPAGGDTARLTVLLVSLDKDRNIQSSIASTLDIAVKNSTEVATGQLQTVKEIGVTPKTCSVRLVVRDSSGRIGTADIAAADIARSTHNAASRCDLH